MTKLDDPGVLEQVRYLRLQRGFSVTGIVKQTGLSKEDADRAIRRVDSGSSGQPGRKRAVDDAHVAKLVRQGLETATIARRLGVSEDAVRTSRKRISEAAE